jgi:hypothetical protein
MHAGMGLFTCPSDTCIQVAFWRAAQRILSLLAWCAERLHCCCAGTVCPATLLQQLVSSCPDDPLIEAVAASLPASAASQGLPTLQVRRKSVGGPTLATAKRRVYTHSMCGRYPSALHRHMHAQR